MTIPTKMINLRVRGHWNQLLSSMGKNVFLGFGHSFGGLCLSSRRIGQVDPLHCRTCSRSMTNDYASRLGYLSYWSHGPE